MTKQAAVVIAFFAGYLFTLISTILTTYRLGRCESTEPEHVALQTHQETRNILMCVVMTNGLLAAILAALVY